MANKNIIIAPKFTPFTFRELVEPIMAASKAQEETEEKYSILDDAVSYWESLKDSQLDQDTYQTYKKFKKKFDESRSRLLNEGLNESIRRDLMNIRSSYNSTIKPLEAALKKREGLIEAQRQDNANNKGTLIYKKGTKASEIPLSMLVKNPAYSPESPVSGALLAQQGSEVFKNLAKEVSAGNKTVLTSLGLPYQYQTRTQVGMSSDDVIKAILRREDANQKLTSLADMIISSAGIDKNIDPEAYNKAWNYVAPAMMNAVGGTSVGSASDSYGADIARTTYNTGLGLKAAALQAEIAAPGTYGGTPEGAEWIASISKELGVIPPAAELNPNEHAMGGFMNQSRDNPPRGSVDAGIRRYLESMKRLREQRQNNNEAGTPSAQPSSPKPVFTRGRTTSPKPTEEEKAAAKKQQEFEDYLQQVNAYGTWETLFGKNQSSDLVDRLKRTNEFYYEKDGRYYMDSRIGNMLSDIEKSLPKDEDGYYYIIHNSKTVKDRNGLTRKLRYRSKDRKFLLKKLYDNPEDWVYKYGDDAYGDLLGNNAKSEWEEYTSPTSTGNSTLDFISKHSNGGTHLANLLIRGEHIPLKRHSSYADIRELKRAGITFEDLYGKRKGTMGNKWRDYYHSNEGENVGDIYGTSAYRRAIEPDQKSQAAVLNKELSSNTRKKLSSVYFDGETATWKEKEELDRDKVLSGEPEATALYATPHGAVLEIKWKEGNSKNTEYHYDFIKVAGGQGTDHINNNLIAMGELAQIMKKGKIPNFTPGRKLRKDKKGIIQFSRIPLSPRDFLDYYRKFKELEKSMGEGAVETLWPHEK